MYPRRNLGAIRLFCRVGLSLERLHLRYNSAWESTNNQWVNIFKLWFQRMPNYIKQLCILLFDNNEKQSYFRIVLNKL